MKKELLNKLAQEGHLTESERFELDLALDAQDGLRQMVSSLPVDEPSMSWRSRLNGRVHELGRSIEQRRRSWMIWRPALGLGVAGCLAMLLVMDRSIETGQVAQSRTPVEQTLIQEHTEAVRSAELSGLGLASHEAVRGGGATEFINWEEADVETL